VNFLRNARAHAGKGQRQMVRAMSNTVFAQESLEAAIAQSRVVADQLRAKFPKLATMLDRSEADVLAYMSFHKAHRTQIAKITWTGEPVELLFLDAPKKHAEITRCLEVFGPSLIPGRSIIAIQDYLYFPAYVLALCMHLLRGQLELAQIVLGGSTIAFRVTRPIDLRAQRPANWNVRRWSPAQIDDAWDSILAPLPPAARERLEPGRALHLYDCGAKAEAVRAMQALPMTPFQQQKIAGLAKSHHYLGYPELFTAAGYPGTAKQNLLSHAKRLRDWARALGAAG